MSSTDARGGGDPTTLGGAVGGAPRRHDRSRRRRGRRGPDAELARPRLADGGDELLDVTVGAVGGGQRPQEREEGAGAGPFRQDDLADAVPQHLPREGRGLDGLFGARIP